MIAFSLSRIFRFFAYFLVPTPKRGFPITKIGFILAKFWSLTRPHPKNPNKSLWNYVNEAYYENHMKIHIINMIIFDYSQKHVK
jgi:hypothetical protein